MKYAETLTRKFYRIHYHVRESARWNLITMRATVRELKRGRAIAQRDRARMRDTLASGNATRQARRSRDACIACMNHVTPCPDAAANCV